MPPKQEQAPAVAMTNEQFSQLIAQITSSTRDIINESVQDMTVQSPSSVPTSYGNFAKCSARFDGSASSDVDAFLDSVVTYKECTHVSDENALRGLSMLLEGIAGIWWKGVKNTVTEWNQAVTALRDAFTRRLPPHLVFREIFAREQRDDETSELFVCTLRSLLSQLPYTLPVRAELDIVYGLMNRKIRKRVPPSDFKTFSELLRRAKETELAQREVAREPKKPQPVSKETEKFERKLRPRCSFCRNFGHVEADCRKKTVQKDNATATKPSSGNTRTETSKMRIACFGCVATCLFVATKLLLKFLILIHN